MKTRLALCALAPALIAACVDDTGDLGVQQARVFWTEHPDTIRTTDSLVVQFEARPDIGNCFGFSHAEVRRDSARVTVTLWADARQAPSTPPCGFVGYRYVGAPPFSLGRFLVLANQPDSSLWVDTITVRP